ncbi:hypothetical protein DAI22_10g007500 [Oryza sativa Japonica Group]|nr:hypothetical protein DAI22_10g007500 [Oryza sativa Japonica Group]
MIGNHLTTLIQRLSTSLPIRSRSDRLPSLRQNHRALPPLSIAPGHPPRLSPPLLPSHWSAPPHPHRLAPPPPRTRKPHLPPTPPPPDPKRWQLAASTIVLDDTPTPPKRRPPSVAADRSTSVVADTPR